MLKNQPKRNEGRERSDGFSEKMKQPGEKIAEDNIHDIIKQVQPSLSRSPLPHFFDIEVKHSPKL